MNELANSFSELYSYLNVLGDYFTSKIPSNVYEKICKQRNDKYNPIYDNIEVFLDNKKMSKKTRVLIFYLHYKYWCDNEEEKNELRSILKENENKWKKDLEVFKKTSNASENIKIQNQNSLVTVQKRWYIKLFNWIKQKILKK